MNNHVLQSSVSIKIAYKISYTNTSTSNNTKGSTIMTAESTRNTLQLFTIITPFATMFVHVMFKLSCRCSSKRVEIFTIMTIVVDVDCDPVFTGYGGWIGITQRQSRFCRQAITAEYSIETFHIVTNDALQFVSVHTPKS